MAYRRLVMIGALGESESESESEILSSAHFALPRRSDFSLF